MFTGWNDTTDGDGSIPAGASEEFGNGKELVIAKLHPARKTGTRGNWREVVVECAVMNGRLARNSVKTYRFAPAGFEAVRKKLTLVQNITLVGVLGLIVGMDFKNADRDWLQGSLLSLLPHLLPITLVLGLFLYSFRREMRKQRENCLAYELLVGEDFVIRRMPGLKEMEIRREELTAIKQNAQGLTLETSSKLRALGVPSTLEEFDEVRARLSEWMTPTELGCAWWKNSPDLLYGLITIELALLIVFFLSSQSWLLVCSGAPLFLGLVVCMVALQRSAQLARKIKRNMWFMLLPMAAIAFRLMDAILNWR